MTGILKIKKAMYRPKTAKMVKRIFLNNAAVSTRFTDLLYLTLFGAMQVLHCNNKLAVGVKYRYGKYGENGKDKNCA